jgi:hypothetical protein
MARYIFSLSCGCEWPNDVYDIKQISSSVDIMFLIYLNVMGDVRDRDIAPDSVVKPKQKVRK